MRRKLRLSLNPSRQEEAWRIAGEFIRDHPEQAPNRAAVESDLLTLMQAAHASSYGLDLGVRLQLSRLHPDLYLVPSQMHLDKATVAQYADAMSSGAIFPPATAATLPEGPQPATDDPFSIGYMIIDGHHRVAAAKRVKYKLPIWLVSFYPRPPELGL
jgi:hypothetical protein